MQARGRISGGDEAKCRPCTAVELLLIAVARNFRFAYSRFKKEKRTDIATGASSLSSSIAYHDLRRLRFLDRARPFRLASKESETSDYRPIPA